ncbi:hypothetical protein BD769DRAFT_1482270 [Suillus cothurnatus]|nr:hypothetical protein BD769DRAFT_1482270 [Suillus cothurnatus]
MQLPTLCPSVLTLFASALASHAFSYQCILFLHQALLVLHGYINLIYKCTLIWVLVYHTATAYRIIKYCFSSHLSSPLPVPHLKMDSISQKQERSSYIIPFILFTANSFRWTCYAWHRLCSGR